MKYSGWQYPDLMNAIELHDTKLVQQIIDNDYYQCIEGWKISEWSLKTSLMNGFRLASELLLSNPNLLEKFQLIVSIVGLRLFQRYSSQYLQENYSLFNEIDEIIWFWEETRSHESLNNEWQDFREKIEEYLKETIAEKIQCTQKKNLKAQCLMDRHATFSISDRLVIILLLMDDQSYFRNLFKIEDIEYPLLGAIFESRRLWDYSKCVYNLGLYLLESNKYQSVMMIEVFKEYNEADLEEYDNVFEKLRELRNYYLNKSMSIIDSYRFLVMFHSPGDFIELMFSKFLNKEESLFTIDVETVNKLNLFFVATITQNWQIVKCLMVDPGVEKNRPFYQLYYDEYEYGGPSYNSKYSFPPIYIAMRRKDEYLGLEECRSDKLWDENPDIDLEVMKLFFQCPEVDLKYIITTHSSKTISTTNTILQILLIEQHFHNTDWYNTKEIFPEKYPYYIMGREKMILLIDDIIINHHRYPEDRFKDRYFVQFVLKDLAKSRASLEQKKSFLERANLLDKTVEIQANNNLNVENVNSIIDCLSTKSHIPNNSLQVVSQTKI